MEFITRKASEIIPNILLSPEFLDEDLQRQYESEIKLSKFSTGLLGIAILLSVVGLVGLVSHTISAKTKEIGIRTILRASIPGIIQLIGRPFLLLSIRSLVLGTSMFTYLIHRWLQSFAYKAPDSWWLYMIPLIVLLVR